MLSKLESFPENVDLLVVGAGLGGCLAASFEAKAGKKVLLIESSSHMGGHWSPELRDGFQLGSGLCFAHKEAFNYVCNNMGIDFEPIDIENGTCLLATKRGWKKCDSFPAWESYFARPVERVAKGGFAGLIQKIIDGKTFSISMESPVTELYVENGKGKYVKIRDKKVQFQECIWASSETALMDVLCGEDIPPKGSKRSIWMKQFITSTPYPGAVLEFAHNMLISDFTETLAFSLSESSPEKAHIIGSFLSNRDSSLAPQSKQLSAWVLSWEESKFLLDKDNNHDIMKRINLGKRVLERYFPGFKDSIIFHRLQIFPHIAEPIQKKKVAKGRIFSNLWSVAYWSSPIGGNFEGIISQVLERGSSLNELLI